MHDIPEDILKVIFKYCNIKTLGSLEVTCRWYADVLKHEDSIWKRAAKHRWGPQFFRIASRRSVLMSNPLKSYRAEIVRIMAFEHENVSSWNLEEYHSYWYCMETRHKRIACSVCESILHAVTNI